MDNAATTCLSPGALAAMLPYMEMEGGNPSGSHRFAREAKKALEQSRRTVAECLSCKPSEVVFTCSGSEGNNMVLRGAVTGEKKHIIASAIEHPAIVNTLRDMEKRGQCTYTLLPVDEEGLVSVEALKAAIRPDTCLVSVMLANNEVGTIEPVQELCALSHAHGIPFHTDAVQAVGHIHVSIQALGVDYLTLAAHKFHGPKGVGAVYIKQDAPMHPFITGGEQEHERRAGTENLPGVVGMAFALREQLATLQKEGERLRVLRDKLIAGVQTAIPEARLNGSRTKRLPQNISLSFPHIAADQLLMYLDQRGIAASSGSACTAGSLEPSHVLLAMGRNAKEARSALRLSLSRFTTEDEVDLVTKTVVEAVQRLGKGL